MKRLIRRTLIGIAAGLLTSILLLPKIQHPGAGLVVAVFVGAAFALYPVVLPASTDPALNLTIYNTAAGQHGLAVGFTWWILGMILALGYFFFLFRMFKGKVRLEGEGY